MDTEIEKRIQIIQRSINAQGIEKMLILTNDQEKNQN